MQLYIINIIQKYYVIVRLRYVEILFILSDNWNSETIVKNSKRLWDYNR